MIANGKLVVSGALRRRLLHQCKNVHTVLALCDNEEVSHCMVWSRAGRVARAGQLALGAFSLASLAADTFRLGDSPFVAGPYANSQFAILR